MSLKCISNDIACSAYAQWGTGSVFSVPSVSFCVKTGMSV